MARRKLPPLEAAAHVADVAEALERRDVIDVMPPTADPETVAAWIEGHTDALTEVALPPAVRVADAFGGALGGSALSSFGSASLNDVPPLRARGIAVRLVREHGLAGNEGNL